MTYIYGNVSYAQYFNGQWQIPFRTLNIATVVEQRRSNLAAMVRRRFTSEQEAGPGAPAAALSPKLAWVA